MISKIYIPGRIQVDTSIAVFFLRKFGSEKFPGIDSASIEIMPVLPEGKSEAELLNEGIFLLDVGKGRFDHHGKDMQLTCSLLVAQDLQIAEDKSIAKLLTMAERDDAFGKGIISNDLVDKALGFPGLIVSINRQFDNDPNKVFKIVEPLLEAHYADEMHTAEELPKEIEQRKKEGNFFESTVRYRGRPILLCMTQSDDSTMSSFLRSKRGGGFDVVALWRNSGHINIITKQYQKLDIRSLVALVRKSEAMMHQVDLQEMDYLSSPQRIDEVPNWYFDTATNSLQNGGITPTKNIEPTQISRESMWEILKLGLEEKLWRPEMK